jgi:hypothetical protein
MSRENLIALHSAFREASKWPEPVRATVIRWFADTIRSNGREQRSPVAGATIATASRPTETWPEVWQAPARQRRSPKPKLDLRLQKPDRARLLELEILTAMQAHPGASVAQLAALVGSGKSRVMWRLQALASRGEIEKAPDGHWRLAAEGVDAA